MYLETLLGNAYKEGMTAEEIAEALEAAGIGASTQTPTDDLSREVERLKRALSKSNAESADRKRQLNEKQTDEERRAQEDAERWELLQQERDTLLREKIITENKAQFLALGYDETLAIETAQAMSEGNTAQVFAAQKKHQENQEKALRATLLREIPDPPAGAGGSGGVDYQKKYEEAQAAGNSVDAAYYMRMSAQEAAQTT